MFGDEKTLPIVEDILAKKQQQQQEGGIGIDDISAGIDLSLKYMMQVYSDTLETMSGINTTQQGDATEDEGDCADISTMHGNEAEEEEIVGNVADETSFLQLPVQVHLHILSYLEASDICQLSATCQLAQSLCTDELLWRDTLNREKTTWTELSNASNPALYKEVNSDLSNKEIYMRCNPRCTRQQHIGGLLSIPRLLWSFLPQKAPKIVMFGPGLDSSTSGIVRKLIGDTTGVFQIRGVFPAEQPGVGTGFNISVNNKAQLRLITLYSGTKRDRTNAGHLSSRADRNKLLRPAPSAGNADSSAEDDEFNEMKYEPTPAVRNLCSSTDAFIFVVDASAPLETIEESRPELFAMLNERWTPNKSPLLVLSCVPDRQQNKVPCVDVAEQLAMHRLNRVWKMLDADVSSLSGVVEGITWLLDATHKR